MKKIFVIALMSLGTSSLFAESLPYQKKNIFFSKVLKKSTCTVRYTVKGPNGQPVQVQTTITCECTQQQACAQAALQVPN